MEFMKRIRVVVGVEARKDRRLWAIATGVPAVSLWDMAVPMVERISRIEVVRT